MIPYEIDPTRANKNWNSDKILSVWGCPYDFETVKMLGHLIDSGAGTFELPETEELMKLVRKHDKGTQVFVVRILLAYLTLFSTYADQTIVGTVSQLEGSCPIQHPSVSQEWEEFFELFQLIIEYRKSNG